MYFGKNISWKGDNISNCYRVFSLTWPKSMQIHLDKKNRLQKKRVQFPRDWFGTPIWPPWCHVKTLYGLLLTFISTHSFCKNSFAVILVVAETMGAIHSTTIFGNFGPKPNGSVRSNRKSFKKTGPPFEEDHFSRSDRSEFWLNGSRPMRYTVPPTG